MGSNPVDGLGLSNDPAVIIPGKVPGGKAAATYGKVLAFHFTVPVEGAGEAQVTTTNRLGQAILGIAGDGKTTGTGQKPIIVVGIDPIFPT